LSLPLAQQVQQLAGAKDVAAADGHDASHKALKHSLQIAAHMHEHCMQLAD
jgi:hypothetical protein